ncbi:MAG TPA: alanine--tRNA ligase, partial [Candidatus Hydrogenedentes bacterium]|nr:alanine--tRNA ligase [Candidatus Hydrogenedentota bacterium]
RIPAERVWVTVYTEDDEAAEIWEKEVGISPSRIVRMGAKDNFWGPAGDTGACGPCSELLYDRGAEVDPEATPDRDPHERFLEFWNLVFPQYDQQPDGSRPPLKNRGIDTGMGLERMAMLLQGKQTVFDTDGLYAMIDATASIAGVPYETRPVPYRVIADHIRALSFMLADGILPGNEGRGYVFRRLLRRAARFGRELGMDAPFLYRVSEAVVDRFGHQYPELVEGRTHIARIIRLEEERFAGTLARGMELLANVFDEMARSGEKVVSGDTLFTLHDTYGFPLDLAADMAEEKGYTVDRDGFERAMARQREKARGAWAGSGQAALPPVYRAVHARTGDTEFVGYETLECEGTILAIIRDGEEVDTVDAGEAAEVILDRTPFYAEAGGQVADTGNLAGSAGEALVEYVSRPVGKMTVHQVKTTRGRLAKGDRVTGRVDAERRRSTERHHTATHLLQAALRQALGEHVHQAGSYVGPDRLRFDFTHFEGLSQERIEDIERLVNAWIREDLPVNTALRPIEEARAEGAMALFGEKYDPIVRTVRTGDISLELCGGCHVSQTGVIGLFKILSESALSAGVRRIEAVCGAEAVEAVQEHERWLQQAARALSVAPDGLPDRVRALQEEIRKLQREVERWKQTAATGGTAADPERNAVVVSGVRVVAVRMDDLDAKSMRAAMDRLKDKLRQESVIVLAGACEGKAALIIGVTPDLTGRISAKALAAELAPLVEGSGGGRADMAQAGGKRIEGIDACLKSAPRAVERLLQG